MKTLKRKWETCGAMQLSRNQGQEKKRRKRSKSSIREIDPIHNHEEEERTHIPAQMEEQPQNSPSQLIVLVDTLEE